MDGNFSKSRSGSTEMLPGWLGSVLSGTLLSGPTATSINSGQTLRLKSRSDENKTKDLVNFLEDDLLPPQVYYLVSFMDLLDLWYSNPRLYFKSYVSTIHL